MRNSSYAPHYAISRYSIREFNTGAEPFMVEMIIIIIIINFETLRKTHGVCKFDLALQWDMLEK